MEGPTALRELAVDLQMLAIGLVGIDVNPQFINPATLLANGVVEPSWVCAPGAQIGLTESNFSYTNGVQVEAADDTLTFRQFGRLSADGTVLSPELAKRFVNAFDDDNWFAVGLEFLARLSVTESEQFSLASLWDRVGERFVRQDVSPGYSVSTFYRFADRTMSVNINRGPTGQQRYILCSGSVHRNLDGDASEGLRDQVIQICTNWVTDWEEVISAATSLVNANLPVGGPQ